MDANKAGLIMIIAMNIIRVMERQMPFGMDITLDGTKDTVNKY